ncbi:MAG TPA: DNA primase DnaG [archaeon]|nr:DNA primase DnaG [archaeon]
MAKTYINTVKYMINLNFEIDGIVEKPDIIGAIFGQSEGLLGDEMDLKELQKNGKVGRIEIDLSTSMGRTKGKVDVPSSMDMAETSILAAGIESVDKVGPCEAHFEIVDISDTRSSKREEIKNRAKELLQKMLQKSSPETQQLTEEIKENVRAAEIKSYGPDKLPAGPDIDSSDEIIVVEGRADVLNMLKNQIKNVIGMNGSNISKTISDLSRRKSLTVFVDGDRGGLLNAKKLMQIAEVDFVAKAPDGKEVEELTRKEIIQSLKKKIPAEEELGVRKHSMKSFESGERNFYREKRSGMPGASSPPAREAEGFYPRRPSGIPRAASTTPLPDTEGFYPRKPSGMRHDRGFRDSRPRFNTGGRPPFGDRPMRERSFSMDDRPAVPRKILSAEEESVFRPVVEGLKGTLNAKILDAENKPVKEVKVKSLVEELAKTKKAHAIVFDGVVTKRLVEAAEKAGAKYVIGVRKGKLEPNASVKAEAL